MILWIGVILTYYIFGTPLDAPIVWGVFLCVALFHCVTAWRERDDREYQIHIHPEGE